MIKISYLRHYEPAKIDSIWRCAAYYQNKEYQSNQVCLIVAGKGKTRYDAFNHLKACMLVELERANREATSEDLTSEAEEKKQ